MAHTLSILATFLALVISAIPAHAQLKDPKINLAGGLLPNRNSVDYSTITGEQVFLRPFALTLLANSTHVQATLNVSQGYDKVGWIALGLGTTMSDSAMVVLWPSEDSRSWVVSHRTAGGHAKPDYDPATASSSLGKWALVPDLTTLNSQPGFTVVTLVRTLSLPKKQIVYPSSRTKFANLSKAKGQKLIFAMSSRRPQPASDEGATMSMHDPGMFGMLEMDLGRKWVEPTTAAGSNARDSDQGWTKFDRIVAAHATSAMLTWLLVAPSGVLLARLGRRWGSWFHWHSGIQLFGTLPLTCVTMGLGFAAAVTMGSASSLDLHKTLGLVLVLLVVFQLSLGQLSHLSHFASTRGSTRPLVRVFHILLGLVLLPLAFATIFFGIEEWREHSSRAPEALVYILLAGIALFALPYIVSLLVLGIQRFKEGRTLYHALFGLGQSCSPSAREPSWMKGLPSNTAGGGASARHSYIDHQHVKPEGSSKRRSTASSSDGVDVKIEIKIQEEKGEWQK